MRLWNKAAGEPWAITASALTNILDIAARQNAPPEAVAAKLGRELQNSYRTEIRDNIAVLPVVGPLFRYANLFTQVSGASSYELLAKDFHLALEDPNVQAIVLNIDSPGGEVNGCAEFADMIYEARGTKPIIAYASGDAASGAYWIAAAADEIVVSKTSSLGSIGVVGVYRGNKDDKAIEIVSSQSPYKRLDPGSDEGRLRLQKRIDVMADVFVEAVAKYRGISAHQVQNQYGAGDVFIGDTAVQNGLADRIGTFEKLLNELQSHPTSHLIHSQSKEISMETINNLQETYPDLMAAFEKGAFEGGKQTERIRIRDILMAPEAVARTDLAYHLAFATEMTGVMALDTLKKAPEEAPKIQDVSGFSKTMAAIPNPQIMPSQDSNEEETFETVAKRLATY